MEAVTCRVLLEIAKNGNITKTARVLGYTQAGVSFMIKKLEEECGFPLLFREKKGCQAYSRRAAALAYNARDNKLA